MMQHGCTKVTTTQKGNNHQGEQVTEKKTVNDKKENLAKRFEVSDPETAGLIRDNETEVTVVPTSFLRNGEVFLLNKFAKTRPVMVYVGIAGETFSVMLSGNPEGFSRFLASAKSEFVSRDQQIEVARGFLEWTRSSDERLEIVERVQAISPRPNLNDIQKKAFEEFREKYSKIVVSPNCTGDDPIECSLYAVHEQDLVKIGLRIFQNGKVERSETVVEKDLLIPYAL